MPFIDPRLPLPGTKDVKPAPGVGGDGTTGTISTGVGPVLIGLPPVREGFEAPPPEEAEVPNAQEATTARRERSDYTTSKRKTPPWEAGLNI